MVSFSATTFNFRFPVALPILKMCDFSFCFPFALASILFFLSSFLLAFNFYSQPFRTIPPSLQQLIELMVILHGTNKDSPRLLIQCIVIYILSFCYHPRACFLLLLLRLFSYSRPHGLLYPCCIHRIPKHTHPPVAVVLSLFRFSASYRIGAIYVCTYFVPM